MTGDESRFERWRLALTAVTAFSGLAATFVAEKSKSSTGQMVGLLVSVVLLAAFVILTAQDVYSTRRQRAETPEEALQRRLKAANRALRQSAGSLEYAVGVITDLQQELSVRQQALEELNAKLADGEKLAQINAEATEALNRLVEANMNRSEKRIGRLAWAQGGLYAVFGAAVAVLATGYADRIVHWFK